MIESVECRPYNSFTETTPNPLEGVDARTKLVGSNKMEILLFTLGTRETFGINVFKVREVSRTPPITKTPNMPTGVEGCDFTARPHYSGNQSIALRQRARSIPLSSAAR
jgi:hypothetical protein